MTTVYQRGTMHIGVIGLNHKLAPLALRETMTSACISFFEAEDLFIHDYAFVLLSMCNRTEIYFSSPEPAQAHTLILNQLRGLMQEKEDYFDQKLYSYFGKDCLWHFARVTAGLDSAEIGETEIQGQVKTAYEKSIKSRSELPSVLHFLFQKCLKIGKAIRTNYALSHHPHAIEHAVFEMGTEHLKKIKDAKVLFIGTSEINQKVCRHLKKEGITNITFCNRTHENAKTLAGKEGVNILKWDEIASWVHYDWVIVGTKAPGYLLTDNRQTNNTDSQKLLIDLSVPRNIDPHLDRLSCLTLINMDQINDKLAQNTRAIEKNISLAERETALLSARYTSLYHNKGTRRNLHIAFG